MRSVITKENKLAFSRRLHTLRIVNNFTFKKLSEFSGIPASTIATWERGTAFPSDNFAVARLAFIFNVPCAYMFGEELVDGKKYTHSFLYGGDKYVNANKS